MHKIIALLLATILLSCTKDNAARKTLEDSGYTDIHIGGMAPFACGQDDTFSNHFTATNPQKKVVEGVVCCGWIKGCTVRF